MRAAILLSAYNGESYIREQIESILAQQCDIPFDLWVRDDGSTDSTCQILQQYADAGKLFWYTGENLKPAKSFLDLVKHCPDYDFYAFADQDDHWYPEKLQCGITPLIGCAGPALSCANARLVDAQLNSLGRNVYLRTPQCDFYSLVCCGNIMGCTMTFNRELALYVQQYPIPESLIMHDSLLTILCTLYDGTICFDENAHMDYRQHGNNVVGAQWSKWSALWERLGRIFHPEPVSIAQQAQSIIDIYPQPTDAVKYRWLETVAKYPSSFKNAVSLACSRIPHYNGRNMEVTLRLATLLRNR